MNICLAEEGFIPSYSLERDYDILDAYDFKMLVRIDSSNTAGPEDVLFLPPTEMSSSRALIDKEYINYWYGFQLTNDFDAPVERIIHVDESYLEEVDLYIKENGKWIHWENGVRIPLDKRNVSNRAPVFKLKFQPNEMKEVYVRVNSKYAGVFGIYVREPDKYYQWELRQTIGYCLFFGAALSIFLYNLFLLVMLRGKIYTYYGLYGFSFLGFVYAYSGFNFYFSDSIFLFHFLNAMASPLTLFLLLFTKELLGIDAKKDSVFFLWIKILCWFYVFLTGLMIYDPQYFVVLEMIGIPTIIYILFLGVLALRKGNPLAKFFLIAMTSNLIGLMMVIALNLGLLEYNFFLRYAYLLGSLIEMVLFAMALAYRTKLYEIERNEAQKQVIDIEKNNAVRLEKEVKERTKDLQEASEELLHQRDELQLRNDKIETLIKEVHHRVKNNLNTVSSLLNIHAEHIYDHKAKNVLIEGQYRIKAISVLHQNLYQNEESIGTVVNLKDIFKLIVDEIDLTYKHEVKDVDIFFDFCDIYLDIDEALPYSLMLNELITNSYKYAFNKHPYPRLHVAILKEEDTLVMVVHDNGLTPVELNRESGSFGLLLMEMLCRQNKSTFQWVYEEGLKVTVQLKLHQLLPL